MRAIRGGITVARKKSVEGEGGVMGGTRKQRPMSCKNTQNQHWATDPCGQYSQMNCVVWSTVSQNVTARRTASTAQ